MDEPKNITISFLIDLMVSIGSTYLFSLKLITLTNFITIIVGGVIVIIITGFQSKIKRIEVILVEQKLKIKELSEELKNQEQLIDIKADVKELQRYLKK